MLSDFYDGSRCSTATPYRPPLPNRTAVPPGRHLHLLMARGAAELDELFPGLLDGIVAAGVLFDQFLGAAETNPILGEWFLRRFSLLDSLYMVPSASPIACTIRHNMRPWLAEHRPARRGHRAA